MTKLKPQAFVGGEEDAHKGDDLAQGGPQAAEEALGSLVTINVPQRTAQRRVDAMSPLGGEPRPQQVQRVRSPRGRSPGDGAGDKRLCRVGHARGQRGLQEDGGGAVRGELDGRVAHVHKLGGHVALPQAREPFMLEDVFDGADGAAVGGRLAQGGQGVGERVRLELEADLDDVKGGDDESGSGEKTKFSHHPDRLCRSKRVCDTICFRRAKLCLFRRADFGLPRDKASYGAG